MTPEEREAQRVWDNVFETSLVVGIICAVLLVLYFGGWA